MESPRGHAAAFQQQQYVQMQNQQYQQQRQQQQQQQQKNRRHGQSQYHQGIQGYNQQHQQHQPYQQQQQQTQQDYTSVGSHYSVDSTRSGSSSQVDEGYRKIGLRLSIRAHGDGPIIPPRRLSRIGLTETSLFAPYGDGDSSSKSQEGSDESNPATSSETTVGSTPVDRTTKVARKQYSDHGNHHHQKVKPRDGNVLRKMTMDVTQLFRAWQLDTSRRNKKRLSPKTMDCRSNISNNNEPGHPTVSGMSPHRFAFSQLGLNGSGVQDSSQPLHNQLPTNWVGDQSNERGLSAVIESTSSQTSSQSNTPASHQSSVRSRDISLASKLEVSTLRSLPQGKCLINPSEPVSNKGRDNSEGNLIVHENDSISVSRSQIHVLSKDKMNVKRADFRIQNLLGQGTFAHVFQCLHVQTGNLVAIKIVKNKQAYTRQAAVEIDVFRALTQGKSAEQATAATSSSSLRSDRASVSSRNGEEKSEHMVDLVCYFMHQNHLCLVFELLGLNLYEVLKKRQFRGLPLDVVRILVKQAVLGVKELAKKNIVHCDLKPENILLISEDDADSMVSSGESRRSSSRSLSSMDKKQDPPTSTATDDKTAPCMTVGPSVGPISQSPSNSLGTNGSTITAGHSLTGKKIKLIDFGSACFEGQSTHTYIQSRFYRSPEVLLGLPYDSAVDMWSLGCVAAELFLGLPILPGIHEHDQLTRICEMISNPSDWMLDQGSNVSKFFVKSVQSQDYSLSQDGKARSLTPNSVPQWRVRTQQEYIQTLTQSEIKKKGGLAKLEKQPVNRYFKKKLLADIIAHKGQSGSPEDRDNLDLFVHFLYGILDPDPWRRWTAVQVVQHPFLTGGSFIRKSQQSMKTPLNKDENQANILCDIYWEAPWDTNVCRRKLLTVQKTREKLQLASKHGGTQGRITPTRSSSASSHDHASSQVDNIGDQNAQKGSEQQRLSFMLANQAAQIHCSSIYTDHFQGGARSVTDASSVVSVGQHTYTSGPLSFNDSGYSTGFLQNSFAEADFACALQRPGVVPMGDESVASSIDMHAVRRSQQHQQHAPGSLGGNYRNHLPSGIGSLSYGDTSENYARRQVPGLASGSVGTGPVGLGHQLSAVMQLPDAPWQQAPGAVSQHQTSSLLQIQQGGATSLHSFGHHPMVMQPLDDPRIQAQFHQQQFQQNDPTSLANSTQQQLAFDHAQVYLQQQHLALQQQQMMLQQQQSALALQQQQLHTYGLAPSMTVGSGQSSMVGGGVQGGQILPNGAAGQQVSVGVNQYGSGGYYFVTAADGTQLMLSAAGLPYQQGTMDPRYYQDPNLYQQG